MQSQTEDTTADLAEQSKPWIASLIRKMSEVLEQGIPEAYNDYPTPVEGFLFELHADLPQGFNQPLLDMIMVMLPGVPEFQQVEAKFKAKYGRTFLIS